MLEPRSWLLFGLVFVACVLGVLGLGRLLLQQRVRRRLQGRTALHLPPVARASASGAGALGGVLDSLSRLSVPEGGWQNSQLRLRFIRAGLRDPGTPRRHHAIKTALTLLLPGVAAALLLVTGSAPSGQRMAFWGVVLAAAGHYLPDAYLRFRTSHRAAQMRDVLPDLIDLLVICTESGLGMDAAIHRVSQEIRRSCPALAEEFYLAALEIRAGAGRSQALKNLALRVDLEDLHALVSMLVQADRFGTSLADSLRVQSEMMRIKRMQRAEEIAAKVPVKMLLPLILFIFPALLAVLIGPAVIRIGALFGT
jgi:tight adherence protein C